MSLPWKPRCQFLLSDQRSPWGQGEQPVLFPRWAPGVLPWTFPGLPGAPAALGMFTALTATPETIP